VAAVFGVVVALWLTRPILADVIPGLTDTGIALAGAVALFVIPSGMSNPATPWRERFLMDWSTAKRLPWGILILFGGGLALAAAINETGLAAWIGSGISAVETWPVLLIMAATATIVIFLTELTSNTATTAAFLPVVASVAVGIGQNPMLLAVTATLAASAAFMLPVATPPNAIVYGSNLISIPRMARTGAILNGAFIVILSLMVYFLVQWVFGVQPGVLPAWAALG
jgi:sodium-dependent dicarboxylate transporter 2/3/5